ncbi:MAG: response regulator [Ignavibacteriales bacterium]|nr:response regulator [Ignavibacteriales bacterium]MCF8315640.1 response regulator [Ignavibacteriales bacterium]MCF8437166.1 response regulator [Ignavibacteriales bacterium]
MIILKTILLVEDDPRDVELTAEALNENHLANNLVIANDGVEALEFLRYQGKYKDRRPEDPAVILLDIKMPKMSGIEVLKHIRNDEKLNKLPVVMLTSSREEPDLLACYELGVNAYVVKPVEFKEFMEAVKLLGVFWGLLNELPIQNHN